MEPIRRLDLSSFAGDAWATQAGQAPPPADVPLLRVKSTPVRWSVVPMDGVEDDASEVADAVTSIDARAVKIGEGPRGQAKTTLTTSIVEREGMEWPVGRELTEDDVSQGQTIALAIPTLTIAGGSAAALWIYAEVDADTVESFG